MLKMRISWWLKRGRRVLMAGLILLIIYLLHQLSHESNKVRGGNRQKTGSFLIEGPDTASLAAALPHPSSVNRWVVVHSNSPKACEQMAVAFSGWNVVMAGHKPAGTRYSRCNWLVGDQPFDSENVFLAACLKAIKAGAEAVYVVADASSIEMLESPNAVFGSQHTGLVVKSSLIMFDYQRHFGCGSIVDRDAESQDSYLMCQMAPPAIQVGLSPSCKIEDASSEIICDKSAPSVAINTGTYLSVPLGNALYLPEAYWALPMAALNSISHQYMMSFAVQKLLWEADNMLMVQIQEGSTAVCNLMQDEAFSDMMQFLEDWNCSDEEYENYEDCVMGLMDTIITQFAGRVELPEMVKHWIHILRENSLLKPTIAGNSMTCKAPVHFYPVAHGRSQISIPNLEITLDLYSRNCGRQDLQPKINFEQPWTQFRDILLVIVFNKPHYEVIPYIEVIYRSFFPQILYCGPTAMSVDDFPMLEKHKISFVTYGVTPKNHFPGSFNYKCLALAIDMRYNVAGYLVIADDMLVFPHKLPTFPKHSIWFLPQKEVRIGAVQTLRECRLGMCDFHPHWNWWETYQNESISLIKTFLKKQYSSYMINKCHRQLVILNGGDFRLNGAYSDIYYIPSRLNMEFRQLVDVFLDHNVFLEIAIPTIIRCLENPEDIVPMTGTAVWDTSRDLSYLYFTAPNVVGKAYLHPTKWSYMYSSNATLQYRSVLCNNILPYIHDRFARFKAWNSTNFFKPKRLSAAQRAAKRDMMLF